MTVAVSTRGLGPRPGIGAKTVRRAAEAMLAAAGQAEAFLSVVLCDDAHIAALNREWRGLDEPTDVLSFGMQGEPADGGAAVAEAPVSPEAEQVLGDIVISIPFAARQAQAGLRREIHQLLAHGLLHLLGWDHDTAAKRRAMDQETARLVAAAE